MYACMNAGDKIELDESMQAKQEEAEIEQHVTKIE
jgi:hypothetical protein